MMLMPLLFSLVMSEPIYAYAASAKLSYVSATTAQASSLGQNAVRHAVQSTTH
jgi:hypothetical protein